MLFEKNEEHKITKEILENNDLVAIEVTLDIVAPRAGNVKVTAINILKNRYNGVVGIVPTEIYNDIAEEYEVLNKENSKTDEPANNVDYNPKEDEDKSLNDFYKSFEGLFGNKPDSYKDDLFGGLSDLLDVTFGKRDKQKDVNEPNKSSFDEVIEESLNELSKGIKDFANTMNDSFEIGILKAQDLFRDTLESTNFEDALSKIKQKIKEVNNENMFKLLADLDILESLKEQSIQYGVSTKKSIKKIDDKIQAIKEALYAQS